MTESAIYLLLGAVIAIYGTHIVNSLRQQAFEARQLGQYQLTEKIGQGGMGEVWKASHRLLARPAAIKLIRPDMLGAQDTGEAQTILRRFEREAQATAAHLIATFLLWRCMGHFRESKDRFELLMEKGAGPTSNI
jgi:serine/threonine-protein kinase